MDAAPIPDAAILVDGAGRIAAIGPERDVPAPEGIEQLDLGPAVLLPGLINTHTHLELTGFEDAAPEAGFPEWIRRIRAIKAERTPEAYLAAARRGIAECWAAGVTTMAETGDTGAVFAALVEMGASGIVYQEVFGPHPAQRDESMAGLRTRVGAMRARSTGRVRVGVSPHAPYTVSGPLYRAVAGWAREEGLPIAVHLAESRAETELVTGGAGAFAVAWQTRGIPLPAEAGIGDFRSPVAYLDSLGVLGPETLCIHTVQVDAPDIDCLAARGVAVAHCPLSNRRHGHGDAPLAALDRAGVRIGAGTDSVASVGRLDLLAEARAARGLTGWSAARALGLVTIGAARALGLEAETGTLAVGKWADVTAIEAGRPGGHGPEEAVLGASPGDTVLTISGGRVVYRRGQAVPPPT
jgi:cytosine/adenosine deaminase-related metal-dependent hydrolase